MPAYEQIQLALQVVWLLFVMAFGACVGSLLNVVAYRLPLGISVVTPPSRCPSCSTRLGWRDNIPVFGWLLLRGRCRYCSTHISPEYPLVEASVAVLFGLFYVLWFMLPADASIWGIHIGAMKPAWSLQGTSNVWPTFVMLLLMLGCLVGMLLTDAKTFTIPLALSALPAVIGVAIHVGHALWLEQRGFSEGLSRGGAAYPWAIWIPGVVARDAWMLHPPRPGAGTGWWWIVSSLAAVLGLVIANVLVATGVLERSFADYEAWEAQHISDGGKADAAAPEVAGVAPQQGQGDAPESSQRAADVWVQYPFARREMVRELLFLAPALGLFVVGGFAVEAMQAQGVLLERPPLWLRVLAGCVMGFLIGGGVVWLVRILGSLAFGKEAMGLGDVHMMAGVGACIGFVNTTLAFFLAAFVGIAWQLVGVVAGGRFARTMPYGPYLAIATVLVLVLRPALERGLALIAGGPIVLPP